MRPWLSGLSAAGLIWCSSLIAQSTVINVESVPSSPAVLQCRFAPDGYLYIKGGPPEGFEELDCIELVITRNRENRPVSDSVVRARGGKSYKFQRLDKFETHPSGSGIVFDFETESVGAVSYRFSGKFHSVCVFAETERDPDKMVAEGVLAKLRNGQEVATANVQLTYSKSRRPVGTQYPGRESVPARG